MTQHSAIIGTMHTFAVEASMGNDDWESRHSVRPTGSATGATGDMGTGPIPSVGPGATGSGFAMTGTSPSTTGAGTPVGAGSGLGHTGNVISPGASDIARRVPYVHKRVPRRTQDAIDDLAQSDLPSSSYTHDSNVSVGGRNLSGRGYRRSRSGMSRFQENNRYGQYLEMPKGQRSIFASRELERRRRSVIALVIVIVALVAVAIIAWQAVSSVAF